MSGIGNLARDELMEVCLRREEIEALARGEAAEVLRRPAGAHLSSCSTCRQAFQAAGGRWPVEGGEAGLTTPDTVSFSPALEIGLDGQVEVSGGPTPTQLPGYEILCLVSEGGQGVVYKAVQQSTGRTVAVKILRHGVYASTRQRARFEREIRLAAGLNHPNIVTIYESGLTEGHFFFAMEYLQGEHVDAYVRSRTASIGQVLELFVQVCDAVQHAHQRGIVHRDLKPGNVLVDERGRPFVLDFGLARPLEAAVESPPRLTLTSEFMGTLAYASPEQTAGDPHQVDQTSDVYSLGVMLYKVLTGSLPYEIGADWGRAFVHIRETEPKPPSTLRRDLSPDIDVVVLKALRKQKAERYASAAALGEDLQRVARGEPILARRDSVVYRLRKQSGRQVRRHPWTARGLAVLLAWVVTAELGVRTVFQYTPLNEWFEQLATLQVSVPPPAKALDHVRVVTVTDRTDITALAAAEHLDGVSDDDKRSARRLHGRFMERMCLAGCRVVAWDLVFGGVTPFDGDFLRGARALREAGVEVLMGSPDWRLNENDVPPEVSPPLAAELPWGALVADLPPKGRWFIDLAMQRGLREPQPSLALATYAAFRQTGAEASIRVHPYLERLDITYYQWISRDAHTRRWISPPDRVIPTAVRRAETADESWGLEPEDLVVSLIVEMPVDWVLEASTIRYQDVFSATELQLREWFGGRVVIIGDLRPKDEWSVYIDGRRLGECYVHAIAVEDLLNTRSARMARGWEAHGAVLAAAIVGVLSAGLLRRGVFVYVTVVLALAAGLFGGGLGVYWNWRVLCSPFVPILGLFLAAALGLWVHATISSERVRS